MSPLTPEDFAAYFREVHKNEPYPWQQRLLAECDRSGRWPEQLDLPTGSGKTAALDVAVFRLALDAWRPVAERRQPRRIVLVVDRRTIVDQAHERGLLIASALSHAAEGSVAARVADALRSLQCEDAGERVPLVARLLRGGTVRDDAWAERPDQPLILSSTVDQVGSRLLFRGYGVSASMRPIHAGLLGNDTLFLLDEVHLSRPFEETLEALETRYLKWFRSDLLPRKWQVVRLSATPRPDSTAAPFALQRDDLAHPRLRVRLEATKMAVLETITVAGGEGKKREQNAKRLAELASDLGRAGRCVAVVVNRVDTARAVHAQIARTHGDQVLLVTGRMRPLDRGEVDQRLRELAGPDREVKPDHAATFVVATQCIEAGADLDFDGLVTECASLDALRQRFGRLDRTGLRGPTKAVIAMREDLLEEVDPIYGAAMAATWRWLQAHAPIDFGIHGFSGPTATEASSLFPPAPNAPVLLPSHLDGWSQTAPIPEPDCDVAAWLHGPEAPRAEVQVVWRSDVLETDLVPATGRSAAGHLDDLAAWIGVAPPSSLEAVSLPLHAVRAWLARGDGVDLHDLVGVEGEVPRDRSTDFRPVVRWRGDEVEIAHIGDDLRPGDTLIVPSTYGGLSAGNFDPEATEPVTDLAERAQVEHRGRAVLRFDTSIDPGRPLLPDPQALADDGASLVDLEAPVQAWLRATHGERWLELACSSLRRESKRGLGRLQVWQASPDGLRTRGVLVGRHRLVSRDVGSGVVSDATTESDLGSYTGVAVSLSEHLAHVAQLARGFATACGLPKDLIDLLGLAAAWHDLGKADPRFQQMLHGGNPVRAAHARHTGLVLAKSATPAQDRVARRQAQTAAGYPQGARHELMSVALLKGLEGLATRVVDVELALHLVASHHGHVRPFAPVSLDPTPVQVAVAVEGKLLKASSEHKLIALDSGLADAFWHLTEVYGWFGLAWLETILRLADHRASALEQEKAG